MSCATFVIEKKCLVGKKSIFVKNAQTVSLLLLNDMLGLKSCYGCNILFLPIASY
jgi:hypothetical protein